MDGVASRSCRRRHRAETQADLELAKLRSQDRVMGVLEAETDGCLEQAELGRRDLDSTALCG